MVECEKCRKYDKKQKEGYFVMIIIGVFTIAVLLAALLVGVSDAVKKTNSSFEYAYRFAPESLTYGWIQARGIILGAVLGGTIIGMFWIAWYGYIKYKEMNAGDL